VTATLPVSYARGQSRANLYASAASNHSALADFPSSLAAAEAKRSPARGQSLASIASYPCITAMTVSRSAERKGFVHRRQNMRETIPPRRISSFDRMLSKVKFGQLLTGASGREDTPQTRAQLLDVGAAQTQLHRQSCRPQSPTSSRFAGELHLQGPRFQP